MPGRSLSIATLAALALAALMLVLRVIGAPVGGDRSGTGTDLLPLLFAAAGLCLTALLRHRSPAAAWLATAAVGGLAALQILGTVQDWIPTTARGAWPWLTLTAEGGLVVAAAITAAYATRARGDGAKRWTRGWRIVVVAGFATVLLITGAAAAQALSGSMPALDPDPVSGALPPLRITNRLVAGFIAVTALVGVARDLAGPIRRAWMRAPGGREFPRALVDELLPASAAMRRRGEEDERARLAAELHARVLPDLRRAAEAAGDGAAATDLRQAVEGVEQLMHARQSVVLEEFGLVAALEWLAERTEQRGPMRVELELDGSGIDDPASVPKPVARAAFRVALLAIDNVARHAHASNAVVHLFVDPSGARLSITDNGIGFDGDTAPRPGRGLIDMRTAATDAGATLAIEHLRVGTRVAFAWSRAVDPATAGGDSAAGLGRRRH